MAPSWTEPLSDPHRLLCDCFRRHLRFVIGWWAYQKQRENGGRERGGPVFSRPAPRGWSRLHWRTPRHATHVLSKSRRMWRGWIGWGEEWSNGNALNWIDMMSLEVHILASFDDDSQSFHTSRTRGRDLWVNPSPSLPMATCTFSQNSLPTNRHTIEKWLRPMSLR